MGIEGTYLNIIKATDNKSTANNILKGEKQSIPSNIGNKSRVPTLPLLFNIVLVVLAREIREQKARKGIHTGKEEVKFYLQVT